MVRLNDIRQHPDAKHFSIESNVSEAIACQMKLLRKCHPGSFAKLGNGKRERERAKEKRRRGAVC